MKELFIYEKAFKFSKRVIKLYKYTTTEKKEYVLSKQLLRSGTSIGANIKEAKYAQSNRDFISKLSISLKEASESEYWLELLKDDYIEDKYINDLLKDLEEIMKLLIVTIKKRKEVEKGNDK